MPFSSWLSCRSLQSKLLILLGMTAMTFVATQLLIFDFFIYPSYGNLEREKGRTDMERCYSALDREIHHLDQFTHDWSSWDDSYQFILDGNHEYVLSNLQLSTFVDNEITLIFYLSRAGKVIWGKAIDLENGKPVQLPGFSQDSWATDHPLLLKGKETRHGLFMSSRGPMLVAARPILRTDHSGPSRGTLVMGRMLNDNFIDILRKQTLVNLQIVPFSEAVQLVTPDELNLLETRPDILFREQGDQLIVSAGYDDLQGEPALLMQANVHRDITRQGIKALILASLAAVFGACVVFYLLLTLLNRLIVKPVSALTQHVVQIRDSGKLTLLTEPECRDEIGILTREINRPIQQLASYHHRLRALSSELLAAEESERRKFARDLHDRIGQSLTMAKLRLDAAAARSESDHAELADISRSMEQLIHEARVLTFELSPPMLYEIGLCATLEWLTETFKEQHNLRITARCGKLPENMDSTQAVLAFQIFRELLVNVVKHAGTDRAGLKAWVEDNMLMGMVSDNGVGLAADFDLEQAGSSSGFGLFSIRERLHHFGGKMNIQSSLEQGMTVTFAIPLEEKYTATESGRSSCD